MSNFNRRQRNKVGEKGKTPVLEELGIYMERALQGGPGGAAVWAPAFGPGRDPGVPGPSPASGSRCMEPASPSASPPLSLCTTLMTK